jgi:hypothetical protein
MSATSSWPRHSYLHGRLILWTPAYKFHQQSSDKKLQKDVLFLFILPVVVRSAIHYCFDGDCEIVTALLVPRINQNARKCKTKCLPFGQRLKGASPSRYHNRANLVKDARDESRPHRPFYHADIPVH